MKSFIIFTLIIKTGVVLSAPIFTSIHIKNNNRVYIATSDESGERATPNITLFNSTSDEKKKLEIPKTLKSREILGMYFHHEILYVLSQWRIERGDKPRLHAYNSKKKSWKNLGSFTCLNPKELVFENKKITLSCFDEKSSSIENPKLQVAITRNIKLPQKSASLNEGRELSLEGLDYYWKSMKLTDDKNKKIKLFSASDF